MASETIVGVFDSLRTAEEARRALMKGGIPRERIEVKAPTRPDDIADEAPGQTYLNQPGQPPEDDAWRRYGEILRIGKTVVEVEPPSERDKRYIEDLLKRNGASHTEAREDWRTR